MSSLACLAGQAGHALFLTASLNTITAGISNNLDACRAGLQAYQLLFR